MNRQWHSGLAFWRRVSLDGECWLWTGTTARKRRQFYGFAWYNGSRHHAHHVAWLCQRGPIPQGLCLDHLCRTPLCVRTDHLELVTIGENVLRGEGPAAVNARKTHCLRGHPLAGPNLYSVPGGGRACRQCQQQRCREYERRKRRV